MNDVLTELLNRRHHVADRMQHGHGGATAWVKTSALRRDRDGHIWVPKDAPCWAIYPPHWLPVGTLGLTCLIVIDVNYINGEPAYLQAEENFDPATVREADSSFDTARCIPVTVLNRKEKDHE